MNIQEIISNPKQYMSCLQSAINVYFERNSINGYDTFVWGGNLTYTNKSERLYNNLSVTYSNTTNDFIIKNMDVDLSYYTKSSTPFDKAITLAIESMNNGSSVIWGMDAIYCPWNKAFEKIHYSHYFLIEQIDEMNKEAVVYDEYMSDGERHSLSFKLLEQGYMNMRIIRKCNDNKSNPTMSFMELVMELQKHCCDNVALSTMCTTFANDCIKATFDDLFESTNPENCTLILTMNEYKKIKLGVAYRIFMCNEAENEDSSAHEIGKLFFLVAKTLEKINTKLMRILLKGSINDKDRLSIKGFAENALEQERHINYLLSEFK